jgi:hypothetical protein
MTRTAPVTVQARFSTLAYSARAARGSQADARADLFSFGAIVFELVTGRRAYGAATVVMPGAPPALERLVAVCLAKDPEDRWSSAHDVLLQLRSIAASPAPPTVVDRASARRERVAWSLAALAAIAAIALAAVLLRVPRNQTSADVDVLSILPPDQTALARGHRIPPDGRVVAFTATDRVEAPDTTCAARFSNSAAPAQYRNARCPSGRRTVSRWPSAQSRLSHRADRRPAARARPAGVPRGGTWNSDNTILFVSLPSLPISRIAATGGTATPVPMAGGPPFDSSIS